MTIKKLIENYYDAFNRQDVQALLNMLDENIEHDINQNGKEIGKEKFAAFLNQMNQFYKENLSDMQIMVSENGERAAAEFTVTGTYLKTAEGLPEAKNQKYQLPCGTFFAIKNGKISRITVYYNLHDWLQQVT